MRSANIAELKNHLSSYLNYVRAGEEVVIRDRNRPIAKIVPLPTRIDDEEAELVAAGLLRLPERSRPLNKAFWDTFFKMPGPRIPFEVAVAAVVAERDED